VVFYHGLLHALMHMLAAWRQLAGPFTTKEFAVCFGRNSEKAQVALAEGKTAYHDSLHAFHVEYEGIMSELAREFLNATGAWEDEADGAAMLAWLTALAA
jgi:hypothetical protein